MKPTTCLAKASVPGGAELALYQHDEDFLIRGGRGDLMTSREYWSERELARLACARLDKARDPVVLIGGLGMGYTLRQTLDLLSPDATVVVAELVPDVVEWNQTFLAGLNDHALDDPRVIVHGGDVLELIHKSPAAFDAIMLDTDNGPEAMTAQGNAGIYHPLGIGACIDAMPRRGCLAVWSAAICPPYERALRDQGLFVRRYRLPSREHGKSLNRCVVCASQDRRSVPDPKKWFPSHRRRAPSQAEC